MPEAGDSTFEQLHKRLLVYFPELPLALAMEFINTAYSRALNFGPWSALYLDSEFQVPAAYNTGTVTLVQNSTAVVGSGTAWSNGLVGRQFLVGGEGPFYTIGAVLDTTNLSLERPYAGASVVGATYTIAQIYVTPPTDFLNFVVVIDPVNNWKLRMGLTQEWLDRRDAERTVAGDPWIIASASPSDAGRPRYELWPRQEEATTYPYRYIRKPPLLSANSDRPIFPLRGDVLRLGALAELSRWPGTGQIKNPYFSLEQHAIWEQEFQRELARIQREDQEIRQSSIRYADDEDWPLSPLDANWLQLHDPNWGSI